MKYKRFAFIRKNAKVVIPALILIIIIFSVINHNLEQGSEGLSNMTTIDDLKKDTNINSVSNSLEYTIAQAQNLGR
jgi:hypothetical protein